MSPGGNSYLSDGWLTEAACRLTTSFCKFGRNALAGKQANRQTEADNALAGIPVSETLFVFEGLKASLWRLLQDSGVGTTGLESISARKRPFARTGVCRKHVEDRRKIIGGVCRNVLFVLRCQTINDTLLAPYYRRGLRRGVLADKQRRKPLWLVGGGVDG